MPIFPTLQGGFKNQMKENSSENVNILKGQICTL